MPHVDCFVVACMVCVATGDADAQREAHVRFQKLQMAYDVLRDPEKRRAYDRGQLVSH